MICLFDRKATDFSTNGLKVLQPIECIVTEEINDGYSLKITMPMSDSSINLEMIIKAPTPKNGPQLFRVFSSEVDAFGNSVYYARHIFYDMLDDFIEDTRPSGSAQTALNAILAGTGFTGETDIAAVSSATYQMMTPSRAILGGNENIPNAFVNRWGGEIERDNFTVRMKQHIGKDRGISIRYRKNLTGLQLDADRDDIITRIYPTGRKADGQTLLTLPEKYVDSPLIANYVQPITRRIDYPDIQIVNKTDDSHPELVTEEQAYEKLRAAAAAEFAAGKDQPTLSANVEFVPLETTEEYKNFAVLEKVYLGDTVHIYHEPMKIELTAKVTLYEYDCLTQRYNKIILGCVPPIIGSPKSVVGQGIIGAQQSANHAQDSADKANKEVELAKVSIGDLTVRVTATEQGLESKVSESDLGTDIQQHASDILLAFNSSGGSKSIKVTGDGFDFYNNSTYIGHMGVKDDSLDFTLADGKCMQWHSERGDYSMSWHPYDEADGTEGGMHTGNLYPREIFMNGGLIRGVNTLSATNVSASGYEASGKTGVTTTIDTSTSSLIEVTDGVITRVH